MHGVEALQKAITARRRWLGPLLLLYLICFCPPLYAQESRRVVILYDERTDLPGMAVLNAALQQYLFDGFDGGLEIYREEMDLSRFGSATNYRNWLRDNLREKYTSLSVDAVVAVMGPALDFVLDNQLFTEVPLVFVGLDQRELNRDALPPRVTGVLLKREFAPTLELALKLHPHTRRVIFIGGTSEFDTRLVEQAKAELKPFESSVKLDYWTHLPMENLLESVSQLSPNTVILYSTLFRDSAGNSFVPHQAVEQIAAAANAPVYGFFDQYLGRGIVGGKLYSMETDGHKAAALVLNVLSGTAPSQLPVVDTSSLQLLFDARQLERWDITEQQLPPGSEIRFQSFSLWRQSKAALLSAAVIVIFQALLIGALLAQRRRLRRANAERKESEARFRNMANNAPILVWVADAERHFEFFNHAWLHFTGRTLEDELKRRCTEDIHRDDNYRYQQAMNEAYRQRQAYEIEYRLRASDGSYRWILEKGAPRYSERREFIGFIGSAIDISERRAQESALRASEQRYRHIIENQTDLVCRYTPDTTLTFVNEAYCRFFNKSQAELVGCKFIELLPASAREQALQKVAAVVASRQTNTWEHEVLLPNGETGWHHWIDNPIVNAHGKVEELQAIGRDITDRKRMEMAQQNLAHALRLAVAGELTAMVAHEVSQPLGAIMANAEAAQMLLESANPPLQEIRDILFDIRESNVRADQAIRRMRELLKKREISMQPLDINETILVALRLVSGDAIHRNVKIIRELPEKLPLILGDKIHLQQVMLNLLVNAMDAMSINKIQTRELVVRTQVLDNHVVMVSVCDQGPGIATDKVQQIFDSFYSTKKDGMGLGLAISRSIIESHQGRIWAENQTRGGAVFSFTIPIAEQSAREKTKPRFKNVIEFNAVL
jgi:PAS domain S-box-containing protein